MNFTFTDIVRILCLSCNVKKSRTGNFYQTEQQRVPFPLFAMPFFIVAVAYRSLHFYQNREPVICMLDE